MKCALCEWAVLTTVSGTMISISHYMIDMKQVHLVSSLLELIVLINIPHVREYLIFRATMPQCQEQVRHILLYPK